MFAYNEWANKLFIDCFNRYTVTNAKNFLLMSHLLTAEEVWQCRLLGKPAPLDQLWKELPQAALQEKAEQNSNAWKSFLKETDEQLLQKSTNYKNSKGTSFSTSVADALTHLINHGTYHRAQIASLLRLEGINPPVSDYIAYVREQQNKSEVAEITVE